MPRDPSSTQFSIDALDAFLDGLRAELKDPADPNVLNTIRSAFRRKIPFHQRSYAAAILIMRAAGLSRGVPARPVVPPVTPASARNVENRQSEPQIPEGRASDSRIADTNPKAARRIVTASDPSTRPVPKAAVPKSDRPEREVPKARRSRGEALTMEPKKDEPASSRRRSPAAEREVPDLQEKKATRERSRTPRDQESPIQTAPAVHEPAKARISRAAGLSASTAAKTAGHESGQTLTAHAGIEKSASPFSQAAGQGDSVMQSRQPVTQEKSGSAGSRDAENVSTSPEAPDNRPAPRTRKSYTVDGPSVPLFVSMGRRQRLRAAELRELFVSKASLGENEVGQVRLFDNYCFIDVLAEKAQAASDALNGYDHRGRILSVGQAKPRGEGGRDLPEFGMRDSAMDISADEHSPETSEWATADDSAGKYPAAESGEYARKLFPDSDSGTSEADAVFPGSPARAASDSAAMSEPEGSTPDGATVADGNAAAPVQDEHLPS